MTRLALLSAALLLYTWVGYPLIVAVLARLRRKPADAYGESPRVSVVVATREDDDTIIARVRDLLSTTYPRDRFEVIVALDAARTSPISGLEELNERIRVVSGDAPGGKAAALNAGVRAATGEVLVFTDTAQRFEPDTVATLVANLYGHPRTAAVSGALHIASGSRGWSPTELYWRFERRLRKNEAVLHSAIGVTGAVYAMRREMWSALPAGLILDDLYVPMRLVLNRQRVGFTDRAKAYDERRFAPRDEYRRKARTLTGVLQLCAWMPALLVPFRNPVWIQFVSHKLMRLVTPYLLLISAIGGLAALFSSIPLVASLAVVSSALALIVLLPIANKRVREALAGVGFMQLALVRAAWNAIRGEWDVWR